MRRSPSEAVTPRPEDRERGAVLIAVLVFMIAVGIICTALAGLTTDGLDTASAIGQARALHYAGDSALETAIQQVRYSGASYATAADCLAGGTLAVDGYTLQVRCSAVASSVPGTRSVAFSACRSTDPACSAPIAKATVTFNDVSASTCSGATTTTCGTTATIDNWSEEQD